jgi:hypothetical protein
MMRVMLYEAAQSMLRSKKWSWLKAWGIGLEAGPLSQWLPGNPGSNGPTLAGKSGEHGGTSCACSAHRNRSDLPQPP